MVEKLQMAWSRAPEAQTDSKPEMQREAPKSLAVANELFRRLDKAGIRYCHWKSNEHIGAGLAGDTDLDVLADRHQADELQRILTVCGYKRFAAPPLRQYPAIEDYLGFDQATGKFVHLHLHYELTLGQRHLKGYRLPWEERTLKTRRLDTDHGIYVADPTLEFLLLIVRFALKERARDRLKRVFAVRGGKDTSDFERELAWLRERINEDEVIGLASALLGFEIEPHLERLLAERRTANGLPAFSSALRPMLRMHCTYGRLRACLESWQRELAWYADAINRRYVHFPVPLRRTSPRGGTIIVLLGADGSGKSTLSGTLKRWLGWKLDVVPIYFGSGDGQAAPYRRPLQLARRLLRRFLSGAGTALTQQNDMKATDGPRQRKMPSAVSQIARASWALVLSLEKRGKLRRMVEARNRGMVVVCDRFPQSDIDGFNDGPLLADWRDHSWRICRGLAAWEARPYVDATQSSPDIVIKLLTAPSVVSLRRPEMNIKGLERRVEAVKALRFPAARQVMELDASATAEEIALTVKRLVWTAL